MANGTEAIIGLAGTLTAVKVTSDIALQTRPSKRKNRKKKKMRLSLR